MRRLAVLVVVLLAGCTEKVGDRDDAAPFAAGIVWRDPSTGRLVGPDGLVADGPVPVGGFDLRADRLVVADGDALVIMRPGAEPERVRFAGLEALARPSLDSGGERVVVQAIDPARQTGGMEDLDVFVLELGDASWRRVSERPVNEESPEWSPDGERIAFSSFDPEAGIGLHIVDVAGVGLLDVVDGGGIHLAWSADGGQIVEPGRMRIYDTVTGEQVADLRDEALAGLEAAGFVAETRFEGQAGRGTFPLDGAFGPDGTQLVFDGAVGGGAPRVVVAAMGVDGSGFRVLGGPFEVDPQDTNGLNFSETNPMWR